MVIIIVLYVLMGLFGYLRFGADVLGSITLNLPKNEMWEFSIDEIIFLIKRLFLRKAQAVQGMLAFSIFITHGLACYVAIDITWNEYLAKRIQSNSSFWEYFTRTMLVFSTCKSARVLIKWQQQQNYLFLSTVLLAVAIPNLELFISLFGALCLSALGLAFPALIQTCTFWNTTSGYEKAFMIAKNSFITIAALVGLISGTYTSINEIIHTFFK